MDTNTISCELSDFFKEEVIEEKSNPINPPHYGEDFHSDCISYCLNNDIGFLEGNIIKYVTRWKKKNGVEDLKKAQEYLRRLIERNEHD